MFGVQFEAPAPAIAAAPTRADVVCFIGFARRRERKDQPGFTAVPTDVWRWLVEWSWREDTAPESQMLDELEHAPVPIERFETFEALFETARTKDDPQMTRLAAAVRSFFAQGGARCFVVRVGDPWKPVLKMSDDSGDTLVSENARKQARLHALLRTDSPFIPPARDKRELWKGVLVLHGLEEAAFLCLPDLPEVVADARIEARQFDTPPPEEVFVECSLHDDTAESTAPRATPLPACTEAGYRTWFAAVRAVAQFLATQRRDMQLIAAVPQPAPALAGSLARILAPSGNSGIAASADETAGIASEFIQLAWPWLATTAVAHGGAEPPDGALAGIAARTILSQGTHRSLGRQALREVTGFTPIVAGGDLALEDNDALINRITIIGPTPSGNRVLSDQTTALPKDSRPASIRRITASLLRAARSLGESVAFEPSGPALWRDIERQLGALLRDFFNAGALRGDTPAAAYEVRCDNTTMTQNDRDNGRLIALVKFAPAVPVNLITVRLALRDSGPTET